MGLSANPRRPSHGVARYLQRAGYRIIPVNPNVAEVLGERAYPTLAELAGPVVQLQFQQARGPAQFVRRQH